MARSSTRLLVCLLLLSLGAGCATSPSDQTPNRDRHGPADVERYIRGLQREERVRELDPEDVIRTLALAPTAIAADLGVGPGVLTLPLARHLSQGLVYAVDVEPRQLDALRERLRAGGIDNVVPVLASYSDPHLPPAGIDWIFVVDTYHHLEQRVAYLRGLRGDLAEGGRLVILEYKPGELPVGPPAGHKLSHETRFAELREAGFELVEGYDTRTYHDFEVWRPRGERP
jgi:SAM-dependent methyltransferase